MQPASLYLTPKKVPNQFLFHPVMRLAVLATVFFVLLQFIRPSLPHPPVTADLQAPPDVKQILHAACYNCHSNETHLPWFDYLVPAYWLVARDVRRGRERLNFSEFANLPAAQQTALLFESLSQIELGAMALPTYTQFHPESKLTAAQIDTLRNYLRSISDAQSTPASVAAIPPTPQPTLPANATVSAAPNGIAFPADYKAWRTISSTERFDDHTLRIILGNDVAVDAVAHHRINPWPDGTMFAKVAWHARKDETAGLLLPADFYQVEFMIRDSQKYAATKGWGWARWRGSNLTPYGKDASFTRECVGCHAPLESTNFVFTAPISSKLEAAHR